MRASEIRRSKVSVPFFILVLALALGGFAYLLADFATDLVLGFLIAAAFRPVFERLTARLWGRSFAAATITTLFVAVIVAVPLIYLVAALSQQAASAYELVKTSLRGDVVSAALAEDGWLGRPGTRLGELLGFEYSPELVRRGMTDVVRKLASVLTPQVNAVISNALAALYHFAVMLLVVFYGLLDGPAIKRRVFELAPLAHEEQELIAAKFRDVWSAIVVGSGVASLLQGALAAVAMAVVGLPSPVFWGVVMTICAFLPFVGISVVALPASAYLMLVDRPGAALAFFAFCMFESLIIENVVKTKLMGDRMQMHSLLIFLSVLGGLGAFGIAGVLYGPLVVTFFLAIVDLYERVYKPRLFPPDEGRSSLPPPTARAT